MNPRLALLLLLVLISPALRAAEHAAILMYHHVNTDTPPSTSVTPTVFARHLDYLEKGGYVVWPLSKILDALSHGTTLPDKTVAITFDDAYKSVLNEAAPMLKKHGWPFTIFVSTRAIDDHYGEYLSWDELRELIKEGAEIGNHSDTHNHLVRHLKGEDDQQWRTRIKADIQRAQQRLHEELDVTPILFSYPYGEYTHELQSLVKAEGYYGIAQQSGAVGIGFDPLAVPRFPMATHYEDMQRFAVSVNARLLPVSNVDVGQRIQIAGQTKQHQYSFDLLSGDYSAAALACYSNDGTRLSITHEQKNRLEHISISLPDWAAGRRKINCTAPSSKEKGVYYWYSQQWLIKETDGSWYQD